LLYLPSSGLGCLRCSGEEHVISLAGARFGRSGVCRDPAEQQTADDGGRS